LSLKIYLIRELIEPSEDICHAHTCR
jgi:hypothetical protein